MYCSECGSELNSNGFCNNPYCNNSEKRKSFFNSNEFEESNKLDFNSSNFEKLDDSYTIDEINIKSYLNLDKYYIDKWALYEKDNNFLYWNNAACIFSFFWLIYRKLYVYALFFIATIILSIIFLKEYTFLVYPVLCISLGAISNNLYIKNVIKTIDKTKAKFHSLSQNELNILLESKGSKNLPITIVSVVLVLFVMIVWLLNIIANL